MLRARPPSSLPPSHDPIFAPHCLSTRSLLPQIPARAIPPSQPYPVGPAFAKPPSCNRHLPSPAFAFFTLPSTHQRKKRSSASLHRSDAGNSSKSREGRPSPSKRRRSKPPLPCPPSPDLRPADSSSIVLSPLSLPLNPPTLRSPTIANERWDIDDVFAWPNLEDLGLPPLRPEEEAILPERETRRLSRAVEIGVSEEEACVIAGSEIW